MFINVTFKYLQNNHILCSCVILFCIVTCTSKASRLMKLAMANPSMISSSHDTDSRFLRRGGRCLAPGKPGLHSPPGLSSESLLQSSWSEAEDGDEALCSRSALLRRRSLSRWERERRLCLNPPLRLGPSMSKHRTNVGTKALRK